VNDVTVMVPLPFLPSLVAVIVAVPAATPVTMPVLETVATEVGLDCQVTGRLVSAPPAESFGVAVSCTVPLTPTLAVAGVTLTVATGTMFTVTLALSLFPSLVAVIVAVPAVTPVTRPLVETLATPVALDAQLTVRPVSGLPAESFGVAVSWTVPPTNTLALVGVTVTDATGTLDTVIVAVPLFVSLVAVIVAVPPPTPVTEPLASTVATADALVDHVTTRSVSGLPAESCGVAVSWTVPPRRTLDVLGLTATDATGTRITVTAAVSARRPPTCSATTL
jgi:hypothetical protein